MNLFQITTIARDGRLASTRGIVAGRPVYGHMQLDSYSCGSAAAFTCYCARRWMRRGAMPPVRDYAAIRREVAPDPERGSELSHLNRVLRARRGRLRLPEVSKQIRDGNLVIAAVHWPTEEEPDLLHYVVLAALRDDGKFLVLNKVVPAGDSRGWHDWMWVRNGASDETLVFRL